MTNQQGAPEARCQACIDRHDGFYGSWAPDCPRHNYDGTPRSTALVDAQQHADCGNTPYDEGPFTLAQQPAPSAAAHKACKPDMLVNGGALKLALNVLRRAGKHEVADELEATAQPSPTPQADSQPAPVRVSKDRLPNWSVESHMDAISDPVASATTSDARVVTPHRAARAPADSGAAPAGGATSGWKVVPIVPTPEMIAAGERADDDNIIEHPFYVATQVYQAMLAAAPTPPAQAADSVLEDAARESEYRRGYRHGYEQRDAEVRGALA